MFRKSHRESTTPMDFEYDNKYGPVDQQSPFLTSIANSPARRRELDPTAPSPFIGQRTSQLSQGPRFGQPGPQSQSDSPNKSAFATPSRVRQAASNFPQSGARPLPSIPQHVNSTWTPRTPVADYDFSSGGETPNTPAQESEQATPDTQIASKMQLLMDSPSPKKAGRRQSILKMVRGWSSPSPSKESSLKDMEKELSRKHYNEKLENRVVKRRSTRERSDRSKKKRMTVRDEDDSDNEPVQAQKNAPAEPVKVQQTYSASIAGFFHWIEAHPRLPTVLAYYLQFAVNAFFLILFMWVVYIMLNAVFADINIESDKHHSEIMVEIAQCAKNYRENRCEPDTRVPAMEMACGNWETCMSRDPQKLARASVTVKACARIINSFFEEFSYKSMIFLTIIIFGGFNVSNWAFGLFRQQHAQPQPRYTDFVPPQTPHRINSSSYIENGQHVWQTPYQTPYEGRGFIQQQQQQPPMLQHTQSTPALPSYAQQGAVEEMKTPSRRRGPR
ncbi:uncharacterized protein M421DRAFT_416619 [Didymella exigua CBS 183.55]|uniref:Brl1/Brr6 domain-containing protein n=1 Tax=Didymella exigua CBS 183.55 TaxID=1150837 RepID=A0A6A5RZR2_9PLEO|nr:uncharacterized protein M421DRAFT_416619 [Didymella exigua CBS 183.55]KAF1933019.1 hypothetical protein M421DRAFT_416619 [Didymella exigua CBS 183.55]